MIALPNLLSTQQPEDARRGQPAHPTLLINTVPSHSRALRGHSLAVFLDLSISRISVPLSLSSTLSCVE